MGAPGLSSASQAAGRRRRDGHGSPGDAGGPAEGAEGPGETGKTCPRPDEKLMDPTKKSGSRDGEGRFLETSTRSTK